MRLTPHEISRGEILSTYTAASSDAREVSQSNRRKELLDRYRDLIVVILELRLLAGFCFTQLADIEQEINGSLTYDRQPKVDADMIAQISRAVLMSVFVRETLNEKRQSF